MKTSRKMGPIILHLHGRLIQDRSFAQLLLFSIETSTNNSERKRYSHSTLQQQTSSGQHPNIPTSVHPILGKVCESPGDCGRCSESGKPKESNLGRGEPSEVPGRVPRGLGNGGTWGTEERKKGRKEGRKHHSITSYSSYHIISLHTKQKKSLASARCFCVCHIRSHWLPAPVWI